MKFKSKGTVTKEMLCESLYRSLGNQVSRDYCRWAVDALIEKIKEYVGTYGMTVFIKGFGSLGVVERKAKKGRDINTGEPIDIIGCEKPAFRVSKEWSREVDQNSAVRNIHISKRNEASSQKED